MHERRIYWTLLERDDHRSPWAPQFGDYDRDVVKAEWQDRRDHGARAYNLKIISSGPKQADVNGAVAALNAGGM